VTTGQPPFDQEGFGAQLPAVVFAHSRQETEACACQIVDGGGSTVKSGIMGISRDTRTMTHTGREKISQRDQRVLNEMVACLPE
jgi:hypothetical protein